MPSIYSAISKYSQAIISTIAVASVFLAYHFYTDRNRKAKGKGRLKRSNAHRHRPRRTLAQNTPATDATSTIATLSGQNARTLPLLDANLGPENEDGLIETVQLEVILNEESGPPRGTGGASSRGPASDLENEFPRSLENGAEREKEKDQNLLKILYLIAEDQAKREGYVHRGVTCNSCQAQPIRGIRYRCANCVDFDLCEDCEAQETHPKTHLFYKVRIPAQFLGNPRHVQPLSYPGKPQNMPISLGMDVVKEFEKKTSFDQAEVEALYEQFKCLAATEYPADPFKIGHAISRQTFDKFFYPTYSSRPPPPNLIYDRMFALYDTNNDGLIGFEEFILGLAALNTRSRNDDKWKRVFKGYDLDGDGYVERKDFLKVFRAYYALSKDHVQDIVASMEEDVLDQNQIQTIITGSQPISAAFPNSLDTRQMGREGKTQEQEDGDQESMNDVILPDSTDAVTAQDLEDYRKEIRARIQTENSQSFEFIPVTEYLRSELGTVGSNNNSEAELFTDTTNGPSATPNDVIAGNDQELQTAMGLEMSDFEDGNDEFGRDEATDHFSFVQSMLTEDQELAPEAEKDIGNEILYQVTQEGLNELLNTFFLKKEKLALAVERRKKRREKERHSLEISETLADEVPSTPHAKSEDVTGLTLQPAIGAFTLDETATNSLSLEELMPSSPSASSDSNGMSSRSPASSPTTQQLEIPNSRASKKFTKRKTIRTKDRAGKQEKERELDAMEGEIAERGGSGRLNYEEFEEIMRQENWRKFAFVGSWVEMASF